MLTASFNCIGSGQHLFYMNVHVYVIVQLLDRYKCTPTHLSQLSGPSSFLGPILGVLNQDIHLTSNNGPTIISFLLVLFCAANSVFWVHDPQPFPSFWAFLFWHFFYTSLLATRYTSCWDKFPNSDEFSFLCTKSIPHFLVILYLLHVYPKKKLHTRKAKGPPLLIAGKNHVAMIQHRGVCQKECVSVGWLNL